MPRLAASSMRARMAPDCNAKRSDALRGAGAAAVFGEIVHLFLVPASTTALSARIVPTHGFHARAAVASDDVL